MAMVANRNLGTDAKAGGTVTNIVANASNVFGAGSSFKIFTTAAALEQGMVGFDTELPNPNSDCFVPERANPTPSVTRSPTTATTPIRSACRARWPPRQRGLREPGVEGRHAGGGPDGGAAGAAPDHAHQRRRWHPDHRQGQPAGQAAEYNQPQSKFYQGLLSFTLGVSPVSTLEMANVSATLMDGGKWCPPSPVLSVTDRYGRRVSVAQQPCEQAISTGLANTLLAGLSKDTTGGTSTAAASAARWTRPGIGKTGTRTTASRWPSSAA